MSYHSSWPGPNAVANWPLLLGAAPHPTASPEWPHVSPWWYSPSLECKPAEESDKPTAEVPDQKGSCPETSGSHSYWLILVHVRTETVSSPELLRYAASLSLRITQDPKLFCAELQHQVRSKRVLKYSIHWENIVDCEIADQPKTTENNLTKTNACQNMTLPISNMSKNGTRITTICMNL